MQSLDFPQLASIEAIEVGFESRGYICSPDLLVAGIDPATEVNGYRLTSQVSKAAARLCGFQDLPQLLYSHRNQW